MDFYDWLINNKKYSNRSARDIISRIKRVKNILKIEKINSNTISDLDKLKDFSELTCSVKSQIRIAIRKYVEFEGDKND